MTYQQWCPAACPDNDVIFVSNGADFISKIGFNWINAATDAQLVDSLPVCFGSCDASLKGLCLGNMERGI